MFDTLHMFGMCSQLLLLFLLLFTFVNGNIFFSNQQLGISQITNLEEQQNGRLNHLNGKRIFEDFSENDNKYRLNKHMKGNSNVI